MKERLTKKVSGCFCYDLKDHKNVPGEFASYDAFFDYNMAVKRLGEYEDADEEGRLLVLPCKVGDTVYVTDGYVRKTKVVAIHQWVSGHWKISIEEPHTTPYWKGYERSFDAFGKTVFLTREEAEEALAKEAMANGY